MMKIMNNEVAIILYLLYDGQKKRNFEAVLQAISSGNLSVKEMITELIPINEYLKIYGNMGASKSTASILKYNEKENLSPSTTIKLKDSTFSGSKGVIGIIGAGNFTKMTMLPALKNTGANYKYIASAGGVTGTALAKKYGFTHSTTNYQEILNDAEVDLILITTRHDKHALMTVASLTAGKHVFVEKPLALNSEQLQKIIEVYNNTSSKTLTVGFNRRFSLHSIKVKNIIGNGPINVIATMNAGSIPPNIWIHDMNIGGGRIIRRSLSFH